MTPELLHDEDEVMFALAKNLGRMLQYTGGPSKAKYLFALLEKLCAVEEGTVRAEAVKAIGNILSEMNPRDVEAELVSIVKKLSGHEWITSHISAILLTPCIYPHLSKGGQEQVMACYMKAVEHSNNSVRKTAAETLNQLIDHIPEAPESEHLNVF